MNQRNKLLLALFLVIVAGFPLLLAGSPTLGIILPSWSVISYWILISAGVGYMVHQQWRLANENGKLKQDLKEITVEFEKQKETIEELSFTDPLTRVYNRRYFHTVLPDDVTRILRRFSSKQDLGTNRSLVFILLDLDKLANINERFGRFNGDKLLKQVGARLNSLTRKSDIVVRWDDDEFLIMLRDADPSEGNHLAKRILDLIGQDRFDLTNGDTVRCTCSVGWATYPWWEKSPSVITHEQVLTFCKQAAGLAKKAGGNQSVGVMPTDTKGDTEAAARITAEEINESAEVNLLLLDNDGPEVTNPSLKAPSKESLARMQLK